MKRLAEARSETIADHFPTAPAPFTIEAEGSDTDAPPGVTTWGCKACGFVLQKWAPKCPKCSAWSTIEEGSAIAREAHEEGGAVPAALLEAAHIERIPSGFCELDRVLGGGYVIGTTTLMAGEPGVGKSTLVLMSGALVASEETKVLYATGEEKKEILGARARRVMEGRVGMDLFIMEESSCEAIEHEVTRLGPRLLVLDSVQTMRAPDCDAPMGSVQQARALCTWVGRIARQHELAAVAIGHVTKDGDIAGPKVLEHLVDATLLFSGDEKGRLRTLRAQKNRNGSTAELGVFEMGETGLSDVADTSRLFVQARKAREPGSAVVVVSEGPRSTRALLVEVQALFAGQPSATKRQLVVSGLDRARAAQLATVLERRAEVPIGMGELYVNVTGGLALTEPAIDLGIAVAVASAVTGRIVRERTVCIGEVGLLGELREPMEIALRLREAAAAGYARAVVPPLAETPAVDGLMVEEAETLVEALELALEGA